MPRKNRCPVCGSTAVTVEHPTDYIYDHIGLSNVFLKGNGVTLTQCTDCQEGTSSVSEEQQLLQVLGLILILAPPGMQGEELRYLRTLFGLTQSDFAKALGVPRRATIAEWEAKDRIFATPFTEIAPRLVLLNLFKTHVLESEFCFLADTHRQAYDVFTESYIDRIQEVLGQVRGDLPLNIHHRPRRREWAGDLVAV